MSTPADPRHAPAAGRAPQRGPALSPRERFLRTVRFQSVDRVPYHELGFWGQTIERWLGEGMPAGVAEDDVWRGSGFFRTDARDFIHLNIFMVPPFNYKVLGEDARTVTFVDYEGVTHLALKEGTVRGTRASMDQYIRFPVETPKDFAAMRERFQAREPSRYPADWTRMVERWRRRDYPLCLLTNATFGLYSMLRRWMGTENLSYAWHDQPRLVHEMLDFLTEFFIELTGPALKAVEVDYFNFFEDLAFKTGPLLSPATFREFLMPRYRRIIEHLHGHGVGVITYDTDGNSEPLIPDLIAAGVSLLWPCECAAGMDVRRLRAKYGHDLALSGGIDKRELAKGRKEIEREVTAKVAPLIEDGGYIPTVDHAVPPDVSYANFMYYLDVKCAVAEGRYGA